MLMLDAINAASCTTAPDLQAQDPNNTGMREPNILTHTTSSTPYATSHRDALILHHPILNPGIDLLLDRAGITSGISEFYPAFLVYACIDIHRSLLFLGSTDEEKTRGSLF